MFKRSEVKFKENIQFFRNRISREFFRSQKPLKNRQWWPGRTEQGGGIIITDIITTIITIINNTINIIDNGDLEEQSKERETKEEQKSSRDQGGQQVDRDVAGELGFCSTFEN